MPPLRADVAHGAASSRIVWALCLAALLAGCAGVPPVRDGAGANPPRGLDQTPDAAARIESLRVGGPNKPYTALGKSYVPMTEDLPFRETGGASWYGAKFHGKPTASGELYDMYAMTAAHRTLPIPSYARVRNPANGREIVVRINDRGPFAAGRVIDLSYAAALRLGLLGGVAPVELQRLTFADIRALTANTSRVADPDSAVAALPAADPAPADDAASPATAAAGVWLQLGAFRTREAAAQMQQQLLAAGAPAVPAVAIFEEDGWFRVQAGPWADRSAASAAGLRLRQQFGVAPLLVQRAAAAAAPAHP